MRRVYTDKTGKLREIEFVRTGLWVLWSQDHSGCWSTVWRDCENGEIIQIPNNAWACLGMSFEDSFEEGERAQFYNSDGEQGAKT